MFRDYILLLLTLTLFGCSTKSTPSTEPVPTSSAFTYEKIEVTPEVIAKLREIAFQAAREGDTQTIRDCLEAGVSINELNSRGDTLLILATYHGHEDATKFLLEQSAIDLEVCGRIGPALSGVAFKGDLPLAKLLIHAGANVNAMNPSRQTPLMFAALTGRTSMVEFLLASGADVFAKDLAGKTPLELARNQGAEETVKRLREAMK